MFRRHSFFNRFELLEFGIFHKEDVVELNIIMSLDYFNVINFASFLAVVNASFKNVSHFLDR